MTMTSHDFSPFGALLQTFRKRGHRTQQMLAEAIGVHRRTLVRWEKGDSLPESKALVLELGRTLKLNDQETRQLLEASLTALAPHWFVPLPRNPYFTGREEVLLALHAQLGVEQAVALTQSSALHGLGGIGKTQIALEYVYRYKFEYSAVFWITAETDEQLVSAFLRIAEELQLPQQADRDQQQVIVAVQHWLSTHDQWLLICDNVEDLDLLPRFLPPARSGAVLITTRCQALGTLTRGMDLSPMDQEEGMLFLLRRAKVLSPDATHEQMRLFAEQTPAQYAAGAALVESMGGLPLALDQAGAYLEETRCEVSAYLQLFQTWRATLLQQRGEGSREHPASVSTTFALAIAATSQRHPAVQDLLWACALLQPDAIPEALFLQGGEHLGTRLTAIAGDELAWNKLVAAACSSSLLARQPASGTLSIHRLVQALLLDTMTQDQQAHWARQLIQAFDSLFPAVRSQSEASAWNQCEQYLPHVLLLFQRTSEDEQMMAFASLASKAGLYLGNRGQYAEADLLLLRALQIQERVLGNNHLDISYTVNYLANFYWAQFRYQEAEALLLRALHIREQALGEDHAEVANVLNNLAILQQYWGNYDQAEALYQRALHIREQTLGSEHPSMAPTLANLAEIYLEQGNYARAEALLLRSLHIQKQTLGLDHPDTAFKLVTLGNLYTQQGKYEEAEAYLLQGLRIHEQHRGADYPDVAEAFTYLADLYRVQSNNEQAERYYQCAREIWERALGSDHPSVAYALHGLALLRQAQDNLCQARELAQRALTIRSQALGDAHPKTVATRALYDQLLQEQQDGAEPPVEQIRSLLKARGWSVYLKTRRSNPYVYATRKVGKHTQSHYLGPLRNLAGCLAAARTLPNARG